VKPDRFTQLKELILRVADLPVNERKDFLDEACKDDLALRREVESMLAHETDRPEILKTGGAIPSELKKSIDTVDMINRTLTCWRLESLEEFEKIADIIPEMTGNWPDEDSKVAAGYLQGRGIKLPWSYGDEFGSEDYRVIGLRAGGIGVVHIIESSRSESKKTYAAKTLHSFLKSDYLDLSQPFQTRISRAFLEETLPWLNMGQHPHIVSVQQVDNIIHPTLKRNIPFIFSEYIPRGSLTGYLKEKGKLSYRETLQLGIQLCDGLLHAYAHGLDAHRDIKPENVMVYGDEIFQITDFSANVIGSPDYMAPEQVVAYWKEQGGKLVKEEVSIDHRTDQFAVGLVMLEAYSGRLPFSICRDACYDKYQARRYVEEGIGELADDLLPDDLSRILKRILSLKQGDRYDEISDLRDDLSRIYESEFEVYKKPNIEVDDSAEWWLDRGEAYYRLWRFTLAEVPYRKALERYQGISGTDAEQAKCMSYLGDVFEETSRLAEAERAYKESLEILSNLPESRLELAKCKNNLANLYCRTGRFDEAEMSFEDCITDLRQVPGTELEQASCTENLGTVYGQTSRFDDAEKSLKKALKAFSSIPGTEKRQAKCSGNLANVYHILGRLDEAERTIQESLTIYRQIPGTELEQARWSLNLAIIYSDNGRFNDAEKILKTILKTYNDLPGTDYDRANCIESIADIYRQTGRFNESERAYEEALEIFGNISGAELPRAVTLSHLALLYRDWKKSGKACECAREALRLCEPFPEGATTECMDNCRKVLGDEYPLDVS
jgi:tetratricopeptide (TPR) repeat protein